MRNNRLIRNSRALSLLAAAALFLCVLPLSAGAAEIGDAVFPSWYSFPECGLSIHNDSYEVARQYYSDVFGPLKGEFLYDYFEANGGHGLCYGVALTNAAILAGQPALGSFRSPGDEAYGSVSELRKGSVCGELGLPLMGLVKYAYVTQASAEVPINFSATKNDAAGLRAAVADFVYHDGPPVAVGLLGDYSSHEVLAVGLLGEEDIVINDSNDPTQLYMMDFDGDKWSYRCAGMSWSSRNADFDYCTFAADVFARMWSGSAERLYADEGYVYDDKEEAGGGTDVWLPADERMDADRMLLMVPDGFDYVSEDGIQRIGKGASLFFDVDYLFDYLWADLGAAVVVRNQALEAKSVAAAGNESGMIASVPPGGYAAVTMMGGAPALLLKGRNGQKVIFAVITQDAEDRNEFCCVQGTLDGDEAFAVLDNGTVFVTGLRGVSADIEKPGFGETEKVRAAEGDLLLNGAYDEGLTLTVVGDADGDGRVTSADARIVLRCSVRLDDIGKYVFAACDYDGDEAITPADARMILRRSVGLKD